MYCLSSAIHEYAHTYIVAETKTPTLGLLIGAAAVDESVDIFNIVFISQPVDGEQVAERAVGIHQMLPGNLGVIGLAYFHGGDQAAAEAGFLENVASRLCQRLSLDGLPILAMPFNELIPDRLDFGRLIGTPRMYDLQSHTLEDETGQGIIWKRYSEMVSKRVTIRLRLSIPWSFNCRLDSDADEIEQDIRRHFEHRLSNLLVDKSYFVTFRNGSNVILMMKLSDDGTGRAIGSVSEKATLLELFDQISGTLRKRKELLMHQDVIDCSLMEKMTQSNGNGNESENELTIVPVVQYEASEFLHFDIPHTFEIMVVCNQDDKVSDVPSMIVDAFRRSVPLRLRQLLKYSDLRKKRLSILEPFVFLPRQCGHYVTNYFPAGFTDGQLEPERRGLHKLLGLPLDRPLFRKSNRFFFPHERGPYLIDVHEAVGDPGIAATTTGLVSGHYQYRHYMQDNFDDKNWGCAYR